MTSGMYSLVPSGPSDDDVSRNSRNVMPDRHQLALKISSSVRRMHAVPYCGPDGSIRWITAITWKYFVCYLLYGCICIWFALHQGCTIHDYLGLPKDKPPYVMATMQFLAAFLTGMTLTEAGTRYKGAMSALLAFQDDLETLKISLTSSTQDPKIRVALQCFVTWMMALGRKKIAFCTQDFSCRMADIIPPEISHCVLFAPEVLWAFDQPEFQFIFTNFLMSAHIWDREKTVDKLWTRALKSWRDLIELLQVRSPTTKFLVGKIAVHTFLITIPLVNDDLVSPMILPIVATMFVAILGLSAELSDPWGEMGFHDLPLQDVMRYLSSPAWKEADDGFIEKSVMWLSHGLQRGEWSYSGDPPIPRIKTTEPNKNATIDFSEMRTLADVAGFKSWDSFMSAQRADMEKAIMSGRRMPQFLRWWDNGSIQGMPMNIGAGAAVTGKKV